MTSSITSKDLHDKSVQAVLSAIEIYNKPDFRYREEAFAILMCNSWELLLKAKALIDNSESIDTIVATRPKKDEQSGETRQVPKLNRCGNVMTVGLAYLSTAMLEQKVGGISKEAIANIELLTEIRDNAIHLVSDDLALAQSVLEIGTASLKNYMTLATSWFGTDFSRYNFFLMPLSFFHGFEAAEAISVAPKSEQTRRFLEYFASVEKSANSDAPHAVTLKIETKVVKAKGSEGISVRWTSDPSAPALRISEESLLEKYPYDSGDLTKKLRDRYTNYKQDRRYFKLKGPLESDEKYCKVRYLDPKNPKSGSKKFFSTEVFKVFDLHYERKSAG
jgi:Protein of unknown function (DUF3644)